ncbi:MAG: hypothetical protein RIS75_127, partial [Actinomycetota bacterium]
IAEQGSISVVNYSDEAAEAAGIAAGISKLLAVGIDPREIAVLVRVNSLTVAIESALDNLRIPFIVKGSSKFFERREIKQALLALKVESDSEVLSNLSELVRSVCQSCGWTERPPLGSAETKSVWEALSGLVVLADDLLASNPRSTVKDFLDEISQRATMQQVPSAAAVTLATMHAAKGLEWDYVFVPGLADDVVPYALAVTPAAIAEERRLLYVAITRAKNSVQLSWPNIRRGSQNSTSMPSRFLRDIQSADIDFSIAEVATISRGTALEVPVPPTPHVCRICGRGLTDSSEVAVQRCNACPSTANSELISALMQWRDQVAQEMGVLPWLVFTDQTLRAIAEFTPKTREELLNIQGVNAAKAHLFSDAIFTINKNF